MQLQIDHHVADVSEVLSFLGNVTREINMGHKSGKGWAIDGVPGGAVPQTPVDTKEEKEVAPTVAENATTEKPQEEAIEPKEPVEKKGPDGKYPWEKKPKK